VDPLTLIVGVAVVVVVPEVVVVVALVVVVVPEVVVVVALVVVVVPEVVVVVPEVVVVVPEVVVVVVPPLVVAEQASVGTALVVLFHVDSPPKLVFAPAATDPSELTLVAVTLLPLCVTVALYGEELTMVWPLA
jgi:hypothetical protein